MTGSTLVRKVSGKGEGRTSLQLIRRLITPCFTPTDLSSSVRRSSQSQQSAMNAVRFKAPCQSCKCEIRQKVCHKETFFLSLSIRYFCDFFTRYFSALSDHLLLSWIRTWRDGLLGYLTIFFQLPIFIAKTKNRLDLERKGYHSPPSLSYPHVFGIRRKGKHCDVRRVTGEIKTVVYYSVVKYSAWRWLRARMMKHKQKKLPGSWSDLRYKIGFRDFVNSGIWAYNYNT
jgi:hypothetical protein